ncbi:MAG: preprotein translocase subunit SecA [Bdellovibrionaceae bacterium]|nr:preprotein translocase subunit SecA [Pseudobdellovibrionaceae bacterium]
MKRLQPTVDQINALEAKMKDFSDARLQGMTAELKTKLANGASLDEILPEAFATCREAGRRVLGMRHYDVQLIGGMVLHSGAIAEMKTGEGKTLVATLPIYLNALSGKGAHLVTVNDYLASRDAEWMGRLYGWLGMRTAVIKHGQSDREKQEAYRADITYATNNELGFDYLRDNMKFDLGDYTQRELNFAIVDECDSILIDEARTPLIISGPSEDSTDKYAIINAIIPHLRKDVDFTMEEKSRSVSLTEEGNSRCEELLKVGNLYDPQHIELLHHIYQGLKAHYLYHIDVDYMVKDGEIVIVDEFTGRLMEGRRWSDGLHQAVEAKEKVKVKNENQTLATITFQNFFRMYKKLAGMTGTAETEAVEFKKIYNLDVVAIPTNRPVQRMDLEDVVYKHQTAKFDAIVKDVIERQSKGQPVLVGTVSIEKSELLSRHLQKNRVPHSVLNAKHHEREAEIVAQAGRKGAVTIATNMAGRGTDIVLGGNPESLARQANKDASTDEYKQALEKFRKQCENEKQDVLQAGGLYIVGTERHESRRIDNQLRGRSGRQGDPGETRFYLALDDDLMRKFNGEKIQKIMEMLKVPDDEPITARMVTNSIEGAQRKVEGHNFDIRKHLLDYDDVMNKQRTAIYSMRREVLEGEKIDDIVREQLSDLVSHMLDLYVAEGAKKQDWNLEGLQVALMQQFGAKIEFANAASLTSEQIVDQVSAAVKNVFDSQKAHLGPYLQQVQKMILLQAIDQRWKEHLQRIDQLREWINLRAYAQKDPLIEYKQEAFKMFEEMNFLVKSETLEKLFKIQLVMQPSSDEAGMGAENSHADGHRDARRDSHRDSHRDAHRDARGAEADHEVDEETAEALDALKPKQRTRLTYSSSESPATDKQMSRSDRRRMERDSKKKRF